MAPPPRLIAALTATAMVALVIVGVLAFGAACLAAGWLLAQLILTVADVTLAGACMWLGAVVLMTALAALWWMCYRDALERDRPWGRR